MYSVFCFSCICFVFDCLFFVFIIIIFLFVCLLLFLFFVHNMEFKTAIYTQVLKTAAQKLNLKLTCHISSVFISGKLELLKTLNLAASLKPF